MVEELDRLLKEHASSIAANLRPAGFAKTQSPSSLRREIYPRLKNISKARLNSNRFIS